MNARESVIRPLKVAMKVKTGLIWPPDNGTVTSRKRNAMMKTANGIRSFGSVDCDSKQEMMEDVRENMRKAVATSSVNDALHTWKVKPYQKQRILILLIYRKPD